MRYRFISLIEVFPFASLRNFITMFVFLFRYIETAKPNCRATPGFETRCKELGVGRETMVSRAGRRASS